MTDCRTTSECVMQLSGWGEKLKKAHALVMAMAIPGAQAEMAVEIKNLIGVVNNEMMAVINKAKAQEEVAQKNGHVAPQDAGVSGAAK